MKAYLKRNGLALAISAGVIALGFLHWHDLPSRVPIHYGWSGEPDRYADRFWGVLLLPLVALFVVLSLPVLVRLSPRSHQMPNSQLSLAKIALAMSLFLAVLQTGILMTSIAPDRYAMPLFFNLAFAVFLVGVGNFLSKIEPNFFIGVATPWTLVSERNWRATHRFAARLQVILGIAIGLLVFYLRHERAAERAAAE
jgi:uncharacterized membrane protein